MATDPRPLLSKTTKNTKGAQNPAVKSGGRGFVFIGEGKGGDLCPSVVQRNA